MVIKSTEGFLIKFCAFRRRSVSGGEERNVSNYEKRDNYRNSSNYSCGTNCSKRIIYKIKQRKAIYRCSNF